LMAHGLTDRCANVTRAKTNGNHDGIDGYIVWARSVLSLTRASRK
jgi:hypothetical protein